MSDEGTERALIAAVVERPEDDLPRLVYADWLDEHGRPERARLIRVQCELENLRDEEQALLAAHAREWGEELDRLGVQAWAFHRGFPEELSVHAHHLLDNLAGIEAVTPVTRLKLNFRTEDQLEQVVTGPSACRLRALDVLFSGGLHLTPQGARAIAGSRHLDRLEELGVHSARLGTEGVEELLKAAFVPRLKTLTVNDPNLAENWGLRQRAARALTPGVAQRLQWGERVMGAYELMHTERAPSKVGGGPSH